MRNYNFSQLPSEKFHEFWERFRDLLRSCPHHEASKWKQVQSFYSGLDERNQQMIDASCGATVTPRKSKTLITHDWQWKWNLRCGLWGHK